MLRNVKTTTGLLKQGVYSFELSQKWGNVNPPSWFYDYQGLFKLYALAVVGDANQRYARPVPS